MFCKHCGKEIIDGAMFCNSCGAKVSDSFGAILEDSEPCEEKKGINKVFAIAGVIVVALVALIYFGRNSEKSETSSAPVQAEQSNYPPNYEKYLGKWKVYENIGHPDGTLSRSGDTIMFTDDGIDCTDLFGLDGSWSVISDLRYYNKDGNDYYVDPMGDPVGFYYDSAEDEIIVFTPSSNQPSADPYDWYDRLRMKRK